MIMKAMSMDDRLTHTGQQPTGEHITELKGPGTGSVKSVSWLIWTRYQSSKPQGGGLFRE
jgi:hypothetical protein